MSSWNSAEWSALCSGAACPICLHGKPDGIVVELVSSYLTSSSNAPMRGYCCVVLRRHAVEMHELSDDEAIGFTRDIQRVSRVIQELTKAVKLNYEIHGNTIPHLHMHIYLVAGAPWSHAATEPDRAAVVVRTGVNLLALAATVAWPFIPATAERVLEALGSNAKPSWPTSAAEALTQIEGRRKVDVPPILFDKLSTEWVESNRAKFSGVES
jgi:diadenosine tetraphosphate (Ap4A) HIT family hydrolase